MSNGVKESTQATDFVEIYTDGACSGNPGPGGWGASLNWQGNIKEIAGYQAHTTNNQMELMAVIMALESLKRPLKVKLYTDSQYVVLGISDWIKGWKLKNWKNSQKKPVKNSELWQRLDLARQNHQIEWCWVKGHAGNIGNERADQLAREAIIAQNNHNSPEK